MFLENSCPFIAYRCFLSEDRVVMIVNHVSLTPSNSLKLIVCVKPTSVCVCVWPVCLWQHALKCHCCKRPSPKHCMFYELSSEDMRALSSDPACSSSVFITPGHFLLGFFSFSSSASFFLMRERKFIEK